MDGTNAARRAGYDPRFQEMEEVNCRRVVEILAAAAAPLGNKVEIEMVFDGPRRDIGEPGPLRLRFSGFESADDLLLGSARAVLAGGRGVVVVTDDSQLAEEIEQEGGRVISFSELIDRLRRGRA